MSFSDDPDQFDVSLNDIHWYKSVSVIKGIYYTPINDTPLNCIFYGHLIQTPYQTDVF